VRAAQEAGILLKGGGHAMAAGVTIAREHLDEFKSFLEASLAAPVAAARAGEALMIDAVLTAAAANPGLMAALSRAGPYGAGNPEPVFAFPAHRLTGASEIGNGHIRIRGEAGDSTKIDGIAFRAAGEPLGQAIFATRGAIVHLAGTLANDRAGSGELVQLRLLDLAPAAS
jgi:single-stranded-DNA-specific exonuclease